MNNIKEALKKTGRQLRTIAPILLGVLLLVSLLQITISKETYAELFSHNKLVDAFTGSIAGSIFAGNPITSYVIGGELLKQGISLIAVTSFILSWVTVGLVMLPIEMKTLGKKFTIIRNASAFVISLFITFVTVAIYNLL